MSDTGFVDYYEILQVSPDCNPRILEVAYHYFAKRYHPDNPETSNNDRFQEVVEAYSTLRDPEKREVYDERYDAIIGLPKSGAEKTIELGLDAETAVRDAELQNRLLLSLYRRRREHSDDVGIVGWLLQEKLGCGDDAFEFHVWYLKSKGFVEINEQGKLMITANGVDHVVSLGHKKTAEQLLIAQLDRSTAEH